MENSVSPTNMKTTKRRVRWNTTWLDPWIGFVWEIRKYKNGNVKGAPVINGQKTRPFEDVSGYLRYFSKPLND